MATAPPSAWELAPEERQEETGKHLHLYAQDKQHGKAAHPDLPAVVVDTTLKRLHRSFAHFFRGRREGERIGFPRLKGGSAEHGSLSA